MPDIFELGFDKTLQRDSDLLDALGNQVVAPMNAFQTTAEGVMSGSFADIMYVGKVSFTDTTEGMMQGIDRSDGTYKWTMGSKSAFIDYNVSRTGALSITLDSSTTSNALFIDDASNSDITAVDIRRSVGTGSGMFIQSDSPSGYCLDLLQKSDTPALHIISNGTGSDVVPVQLQNNTATSTNFYEQIELRGTAAPAVALSLWVANNTTPNTVLNGAKGDLCMSSEGITYVNTDGATAWNVLISSATATLAVGGGGTGRTSHTAYAVICGGTTSTGAHQSIAGVGNSGQLLTSNGAGALPTFQDSTNTGLLNIVEDTTPQLGEALDGQGFDLNNMGVLFLTEQAEAETTIAGKGQLWVDTATPNILMFTDDDDTDFTIAHNATTTLSSLASVGTITNGVWNGTDINVADGGSGRGTATAYAVICGGTTSTAVHQSIAGVGNSGQILTSNGAGALPTMQDSPSVSVSKAFYVANFEDIGRYQIQIINSGFSNVSTEGAGVGTSVSNKSGGSLRWLLGDSANTDVFNYNPKWSATVKLNVVPTSNLPTTYVGIGDLTINPSTAVITFTDIHIGFKFVRESGSYNLYATVADGGTESSTLLMSGAAQSDSFELYIEVTSGASADFYFRRNAGAMSAATTISDNIPSATANEQYCVILATSNDATSITINSTCSTMRYER